MRLAPSLAWLLLPLLLLGCGSRGSKVVRVSGRVTLDKKALVNATVIFSPAESDPKDATNMEAAGQTDDEGRYSLKMNQSGRDGAAVGSYKVRISLIERGASLVNRLPKSYNQDTQLTFTVPPEGTTEANFDLTSDGKGR
jgi:hypothetical protein